MEAEAALELGLTIDQWDALDDHQRAHALAPALVDAERAAGRCTQCGGTASECQDPLNQRAFEVSFGRCFRTLAVHAAEKKRGKDMVGVITFVTLNPAKKKRAKKK